MATVKVTATVAVDAPSTFEVWFDLAGVSEEELDDENFLGDLREWVLDRAYTEMGDNITLWVEHVTTEVV